MTDLRRICPGCHKELVVPNYKPEFENKNVTCPNCRMQSKLSNWAYPAASVSNKTQVTLGGGMQGTVPRVGSSNASLVGKLRVRATGQEFQLRAGEHLIGRRSATSNAEFQIGNAQNTDEYMSRKAACVEVRKMGNGTVVLLKEIGSVNPIILNGKQMTNGDVVELKPNDTFVLGFTDVQYVVEEPDGTIPRL